MHPTAGGALRWLMVNDFAEPRGCGAEPFSDVPMEI
jgi:hypothetical protein